MVSGAGAVYLPWLQLFPGTSSWFQPLPGAPSFYLSGAELAAISGSPYYLMFGLIISFIWVNNFLHYILSVLNT